MSNGDFIRYLLWSMELWGRNYGTTSQINADVEAGILIPGTMPDNLWREGDKWRKQSEVAKLIGQ